MGQPIIEYLASPIKSPRPRGLSNRVAEWRSFFLFALANRSPFEPYAKDTRLLEPLGRRILISVEKSLEAPRSPQRAAKRGAI